jgi:hypothetical protein
MPYVARRRAERSRACATDRAASYALVLRSLLAKEDGKPPLDDPMHHVYLLRSLADPKQTYIGLTDDMRSRLRRHNEGANFHTAKYRP